MSAAPEASAFPALLAALVDGVVWSEARLTAWGQALGEGWRPGAVLALHGDLGAGKTTLVRAIARGLGVPEAEAVTSPTYAIIHEYGTALGPVVHADLYRVRRPEELDQMGWEELLARAHAVLVEWPEQGGDRLPAHAVQVMLAHVPGDDAVRAVRRLG